MPCFCMMSSDSRIQPSRSLLYVLAGSGAGAAARSADRLAASWSLRSCSALALASASSLALASSAAFFLASAASFSACCAEASACLPMVSCWVLAAVSTALKATGRTFWGAAWSFCPASAEPGTRAKTRAAAPAAATPAAESLCVRFRRA